MRVRNAAFPTAGLLAIAALATALGNLSPVAAQEPAASEAFGGRSLPPGAVVQGRPKPAGQPMPSASQPGKPSEKKSDGEKKPDDGKKETPKNPEIISRPDSPNSPPDPKELLVRPNPDGMLQLNFTGQPWPDVLKWLAGISGLSFDWQELPGGYLNLVTQREYSVPEARNLINRHLLARGYTLLVRGELMTVVKVDKLDPALVPRVSPSDLEDRDDYEFVKVSFPLRWLLAEEAAKELEVMRSPNGQLTALATTNRLEAMDAVINLREIHTVLEQEQSNEGEERLVRPFILKFARAEEVAEQLKELLGLKKASAPMTPQQMQQMQQMQQRAQQSGKGAPPKKEPEVSIVAVPRDNTILVNAPPDKMAVVEQAIEILDQRSDDAYSGIGALGETEVYRLSHIDPEQFIEMMHDMGAISPRTRIQPDKRRRAVIVTGSRSDHIIVEVLIKKLDSRTRTFHVIPLRKHDAEYVAGSIRFMMGEEKEEENQSSSRRSYFSFYPFRNQSGDDEYDDGDKFRVDADVEYNRLLLWCNEMEKAAVDELLVKLGEIPMPGGNPARRRVLNVENLEDAINLIEKLQQAWPNEGRNPLKIAPLPELPKKDEPETPITPPSPDTVEPPRQPGKDARSVSLPAQKQSSGNSQTTLRAHDIFRSESTSDSHDHGVPGGTGTVADDAVAERPAERSVFRLLEVSQREFPAAEDTQADDAPRRGSEDVVDADAESPVRNPVKQPAQQPRPLPEDERLQRLLEQLRRQNQRPSATDSKDESAEPAPINVRVGADGQIYLESDDTLALDRFEELLQEYAPPRRDWHVFELKYPNSWPYGIELILKDIFKEEMEEEENGNMRYSPFFGFYPGSGSDRGPASLSRRKPLKIISDTDSHTILVQGASKDQLKMIEELIAVYDRPTSTEPHSIRRTKIIPIKYSKANVIAEAVKDVYRDLLSENDKALQSGRKDEKDRPADRSYTYIYGGGGEGADQEQEQPIRFKGLLSIGVDELSNNLVVSASQGLLDNVTLIVEALDEAAAPNSSVQIIHLDSRVNARLLREKLNGIFGPKAPPQKGDQNKNQPGQNGQPGQSQQPNVNVQVQ